MARAARPQEYVIVTGVPWVLAVRRALDRGEEVRVVADEHDPHDVRIEWAGAVVKVQVP